MAFFVETLRGLFNRTDRAQETGGKRFLPDQAREIVWYAFYKAGRDIAYYPDVHDAVMGNTKIPLYDLRKATFDEIRVQRGKSTGKSEEELAALGKQFLIDHLGPEDADLISIRLAIRAEEAAVDKKE